MQILINKIRNSISLSSEAEEYILHLGKEKKVSKGTILIRQGENVNKTFYIIDGSLRSYCIDIKDKEQTLEFDIKDWWISDFMALYNHEPASLTIECITDSVFIELNAQKLNELYIEFPEFERFQRKNLERHIVSLHKRILNQLQLSAIERYKLFVEQYPNIEQYVSNYHIASYLGITQQSLSRIRAKKS